MRKLFAKIFGGDWTDGDDYHWTVGILPRAWFKLKYRIRRRLRDWQLAFQLWRLRKDLDRWYSDAEQDQWMHDYERQKRKPRTP